MQVAPVEGVGNGNLSEPARSSYRRVPYHRNIT